MQEFWWELTLEVTAKQLELAAEVGWQMGSQGVVIENPQELLAEAAARKAEEIAYLLPDPQALPQVKAYFPEKINPVPWLRAYNIQAKISWRQVQVSDWANEWKKYYHPLPVGKKFLIKPAWEEAEAPGRMVLSIEPGVSFGSGAHPSTQMCLEFLEDYVKIGDTIFDIGCGSGILAMVAAKLGAGAVWAVDNDPLAVKAAQENFQLNQLNIQVVEGSLLQSALGQADLIVANIVADVIMELAGKAAEHLKAGGIFIASGIYWERETEVEKFLTEQAPFELLARKREAEWTALAVRKR